MSTLVAIGHPYPFHNICDGSDKALIQHSDAAFDLVCYLRRPSPREVERWNAGPLRYGLHLDPAYPGIPLLAFDFEEVVQFDSSLNIHKNGTVEDCLEWLNGTGNIVKMFLLDAETNVVLSMRFISVAYQFMWDLRYSLAEQLVGYQNMRLVDEAVVELTTKYPQVLLYQAATFYRAGDPSGLPISSVIR